MKFSEILTPEEVEHRIRRTFELRKLIKTIQRENTKALSEMKKSRNSQVETTNVAQVSNLESEN